VDKIKEILQNPPREHGIYPIIHDGIRNPEWILDHARRCGFAGAVVNIRYTKGFPDDEAEWASFNKGSRALIDDGLKLWIYDEKGYPSGTAGGAVLERHPEYENEGLVCYRYWKTLSGPLSFRADTPDGALFKALLIPFTGEPEIDISHTANDRGTLYFDVPQGAYRLVVLVVRRLFDGTHAAHSYSEPRRYIDLFNKDATRAFLEVTHEKYKSVIGDEFGRGVRAFFTDEPSLIGWGIPTITYPYISWSPSFPKKFKERYGYGIEKAVIAVLGLPCERAIVKRCDFWEFAATELAENFFGELQAWCRENGIPSSGHLLCEENLLEHVFCYGSYYKSCKRLDWPGIDQLESEPDKLMNEHHIPIGRLAASIADVFGQGESFTEASDHTSIHHNRRIPLEWIKASINWHFAMGINNMTSYYNLARYPAEELRALNRYTATVGSLLRLGERYSRVAVLYPEHAMWSSFVVNERPHSSGQSPEAEALHQTFAKASWDLLHRQIDFDYIDEDVIKAADIADGKLCFGSRAYECVVLPGAFVLSEATVQKLNSFVERGGIVVSHGEPPRLSRETGDAIALSGCHSLETRGVGPSAYTTIMPRTVMVSPADLRNVMSGFEGNMSAEANEVVSKNILAHTRLWEHKLILFVCNMGAHPYDGVIKIEGDGACSRINPSTGAIQVCDMTWDGTHRVTRLHLHPYESAIFLADEVL